MSVQPNSSTTAVTLTKSTTLTTAVTGYGLIGTYLIAGAQTPLGAAVFGPAATNFTLRNQTIIESTGTATLAAGILLASPGDITNAGTVIGSSGILILDKAPDKKSSVTTTGLVDATLGNALYLQGKAAVTNSGLIEGVNGIVFATASSGLVQNTGTIDAFSTIDIDDDYATGFLRYGVGIYAYAPGSVSNTGTISGNHVGIVFEDYKAAATVANTGLITSSHGYGVYLRGGGAVFNAGTIYGFDQGIFVNQDTAAANIIANSGLVIAAEPPFTAALGTYIGGGIVDDGAATITNLATGTISDPGGGAIQLAALNFFAAGDPVTDGAVNNAGLITGLYGVQFQALGSVKNTGTIIGKVGGVDVVNSAAAVINLKFIEATGGYFNYGAGTGQDAAGIAMAAGGAVTNAAGGTILADSTTVANGIALYGPGYVTNAGVVEAGNRGIALFGGGAAYNTGFIDGQTGVYAKPAGAAVYNYQGGNITGASFGVLLNAAGAVYNAGLIRGETAILLQDGGAVTNDGSIIGTAAGIDAGGAVTIVNTGLIQSTTGAAIAADNSPATVQNTGTIITSDAGYNNGVAFFAGGAVSNAGLIKGGAGIFGQGGGTVTNTGSIIVYRDGIAIDGPGTVINRGLIDVTKPGYNAGIELTTGTVTNSGTIEAGTGIYLDGGGAITNTGLIAGANGVYLRRGGTLINKGTIAATATGIFLAAGGTVIEDGVVHGGSFGALYFRPGYASTSRLIIDAAAKITGTLNLNGAALEFAADGKKTGTFAPESQQFLNAGSITIDSKAIWELAGTFTDGTDGVLTNNGTLEAGKGLISFNGPIIGAGVIELGKKILTIDSTVASTQKVEFSGTSETLDLGDPENFAAKIEAFSLGDTIELENFAVTGLTTHFANGVLTLTDDTSSVALTFASPASFGSDIFLLTAADAGSTLTLAKKKAAILPPAAAATPTTLPDLSPAYAVPSQTNPAPLTGLTMYVPAPGWLPATAAAHLATIPPITLHP